MSKTPPYYHTTVPAVKTQGDITKMLYEHGALGTQWTNLRDMVELQFILEVNTPDGKRPMAFRIRPPMLLKKDGKPHPDWTMRMLWWWLKSRLEAVEFGLRDIMEEFLPEIVGELPSGKQVTVGEILIPKILLEGVLEPGGLLKSLPWKKVEEDEESG